jgi:hypothetical protein
MFALKFPEFPRSRRFSMDLLLYAGLGILAWSLLSGCVYFNTYYNADKAYRQAMAMREKRLDKNPSDSVLASADEKLKFERCITKCSKVLELYPNEKKWQSRAVFLMAEAYFQEGEWTRAIGKYDEYLHYFPGQPNTPKAEIHRAIALFQNGQYPAAYSALTRLLATTLAEELRTEALLCLAKMERLNGTDSSAYAAYQTLLRDAAKKPYERAQAHAAAARLAFRLKLWVQAREHALAPEISLLGLSEQIQLHLLAADARFQQKQFAEAIAELETTSSKKFFRDSLAPFRLKMAEGHLAMRQEKPGFTLLKKVTEAVPHTSLSAEAWYRRGDYELTYLHDENAAKVSFDSSASQGMSFEYGLLARSRADALARLAEYRKKQGKDTVQAIANRQEEFMISELFLFQLDQVDSALVRLEQIANSPDRDSIYTLRAGYARAYIHEEYKKDKSRADSLYRLLMERYPGSVFAQQAERNLGLKATVQTGEDSARALFLAAEKQRFSGGDLFTQVIPAYAQTVTNHPTTQMAAKAQFVIAMLYEGRGEGIDPPQNLDSAKTAYLKLRDSYPKSSFATIAQAKLLSAGITGTVLKPKTSTPVDSSSSMLGKDSTATGATPTDSTHKVSTGQPAAAPQGSSHKDATQPPPALPSFQGRGTQPQPVPEAPPVDSTAPAGPTKEVLEPDYDNVDQY